MNKFIFLLKLDVSCHIYYGIMTTVGELCHNKDYLPYLHNSKRFHTLPNGQCLYRHPKEDGVEIVKVSKELRRELFELDKQEYNDDHREYLLEKS